MARKLFCDRCHLNVDDTDPERLKWNFLTIAKADTPSAPFDRKDLCPDCTDEVRQLLQSPA